MSSEKSPRKKEPQYLVDECLGRHDVVVALRSEGATVIAHHESFPPGTDDAVWLAEVAQHPDWVVLTKDSQIRRRPLELEALRHARAKVFILTSANLTGSEQAEAFRRALPKMERLSRRRGPFIAAVHAGGSVELLKIRKSRRTKRGRGL